jgi:hypothetical protein
MWGQAGSPLVRRVLDLALVDHSRLTAASLAASGFRQLKKAAVAFVLLLAFVALKFGFNIYVRDS